MLAKGANGQIEFQGTQVTIHRKGVSAWAHHGFKGSKAIPIGSVVAVQAREPGIFVHGYIQLTIPGGVESRKGARSAWKDENTVVFRYRERAAFRQVRDALTKAIDAARRAPQIERPARSVADELSGLDALRVKGTITDQEFQTLKERILCKDPGAGGAGRASHPTGRERAANASIPAATAAPSSSGGAWSKVWWILLPALLALSFQSPAWFWAAWIILIGAAIVAFIRPLPSFGVSRKLGVGIIVLAVIFLPYGRAVVGDAAKLAQLKSTDPQAYLAAIEKTESPESYLREVRGLDSAKFESLVAAGDPKHIEALKIIDPERHKVEKDRLDAEAAVKRAKEEAERIQKEIAEKQRLEKLRSADPKAYLDTIKGTPNWVQEFQALDPKGYAAWEAEELKKKVPDIAYDPYTKDGYPKTYAKWGAKAVKRINSLRKDAAFLVAQNVACNMVDVSDLSDERSAPGKSIVIFVDCRNHQRFYLTEEEIKAGNKPVSKNAKTALISDQEAIHACEAQVVSVLHYPSSFDRALLNAAVYRSEWGNIAVEFDFDAKNGMGIEVPQFARCIIDDQGIHPAEISNR